MDRGLRFPQKCYSACFGGKTKRGARFFCSVPIVIAALFPSAASAQVVISEFMYDAQGSDTDQEYVELFNAGSSPVDLTKWKINDGSNHTLNVPPKNGGMGSIMIQSGSYALLVDNATNFITLHPGISASIIDTVLSLPNAGGTITLVDDSGATADSVTYTKDMGAAGDGNALQRNSVSGTSFSPGSPTPGVGSLVTSSGSSSANPDTSNAVTTTDQTTSTTTTSANVAAPVPSYVAPPEPQVFADAGDDRTVIVGADVEFDGRAYNRQKEPVDHVRFLWNFGDGATAEGPAVLHHFDYPGRYAVVLVIAEDTYAAGDLVAVTAEPARLAFLTLPDGGVAIENHAGRDLDLSRWIVQQFGRQFPLPDHSIILAGSVMRISQKTLGFFSAPQAELDYPNGVLALSAGQSSADTSSHSGVQTSPAGASTSPHARVAHAQEVTVAGDMPAAAASPAHGGASDQPIDPSAAPEASVDATSAAEVAAAAGAGSSSRLWWLGAFALAALAGGAVLVARRLGRREWDIIEEKPEGE